MAGKRRLIRLIYPSYVLITLLSLLLVGWYGALTLKHLYVRETSDYLLVRARLFEQLMGDADWSGRGPAIDRLCKEAGALADTRFTVIDATGLVLGDSEEDPARMENHAHRPEVLQAREQGVGEHIRHSHTLNQDMIYVAHVVRRNGQYMGVVRASRPLISLTQTLRSNYWRIAVAGLLAAALAAAASLLVTRRLSRPLQDLTMGAHRFARGDLDHRLRPSDIEEFADLAGTMNRMAQDLAERIRTVTEQRGELETVLSSMMEAVILLDADKRILRMNRAAGRLLEVVYLEAAGRRFEEVVRNVALIRFAEGVLREGRGEEELTFHQGGEEKYLLAHGALIGEGEEARALLVLFDATRLRKLEQVRRDFVANVSHELKTPLTSIKGAVETLRDGAMDEEEAARNFLAIISRHAERLNAIIDDLLSLSRIEEDEEGGEVALAPGRVRPVLDDAAASVARIARDQRIKIEIQADPQLEAMINPPLLEQAVTNLLDNAVKYSDPGREVRVTARAEADEVVIEVADQGRGIPAEHRERIFERFYRVDRARSRKLGGTGLGLAIVKHIVLAHHGKVEVRSELNQGSVFTIRLSRA